MKIETESINLKSKSKYKNKKATINAFHKYSPFLSQKV